LITGVVISFGIKKTYRIRGYRKDGAGRMPSPYRKLDYWVGHRKNCVGAGGTVGSWKVELLMALEVGYKICGRHMRLSDVHGKVL